MLNLLPDNVRMLIPSFLDYLSLEKQYAQHTLTAYSKDIETFHLFVQAEFSTKDPTQVNYGMIRSWIVQLVGQGLNNKSINRKIASLKSFYKYLLKIGVIQENPLAKHKTLKVTKNVQTIFSEKEVQEVIANFDISDFNGLRNRAMVELFYATGIRRSELINLDVTDIDFSANTIKVLGKRNKERIVPLLPSVVETLKQYLKERHQLNNNHSNNVLFLTQKGVKVSQTLVYRIINTYFSKISTKLKKSPHIIRHTFATHLLNNGADLNAVKELLGHSSLASTQVYTHNSIAQLKKVYTQSHPRNK